MQKKITTGLIITVILTAFISCGPSEQEQTAGQEQQYVDVPLHRQDSTKQYKYDITLPEIIHTHKALRDTLTTLANQFQQSFISRTSGDTLQPQRPPWKLQLHITVEDSTQHFIALLAEGYEYMGGAHGMPFYIPLNYNHKKKTFVNLSDLLNDSTALVPISKYVRKALKEQLSKNGAGQTDSWFTEGTAPSYSNYENTVLQAQGIRIIFSAYQVGPYALGTPEVDVPASVFREELKPEYKEWFEEK